MSLKRRLFFFFCVFVFVPLAAQTDQKFTVVKELNNDWEIYKDNAWQPWTGQSVRAVYLNLNARDVRGDVIELRSLREQDIFINQKFFKKNRSGRIILNIDSLALQFSSKLNIAVFQKGHVELLYSALLTPTLDNPASGTVFVPRKPNVFLNFSILAVLLLSFGFVLLFRTNPRLTLDYLNIPRLFSVQEREDNLLTTRVTASVNLLFYLFCSASCAYGLLTLFYFGADRIGGANNFPIRSTGEGFLQWAKLMIVIACCLVLKLALIYSFSTLFKLRETAALQFFNFIRMLFFIVILISTISLGYFIFYGYPSGPAIGLLRMSLVVMTISVIMVFLKLLTLTPFRFFHLFSYLCASEIIPLVILLRVLLY